MKSFRKPATRLVASPTVSIVIVNYNGRSYLPACLDSILSTVGSDVELIVIDNQSTDGSVEFLQTHFPQLRLVCNAENSGYAGGNNLGAIHAQGEVLVILNPDTVVQSGWLAPLIQPLTAQSAVGMTTPRLVLLNDPQRLNTAGNTVHISGLTLCRGLGESQGKHAETAVVSAVSGAAFAIRRTLFEKIGGFDSRFFMYMEDTDLSLRAQLLGYDILYVADSIIHHDYVLKFGPQKTYYQERNRYLMLLKNARWGTLGLMLPMLLLTELITWGFVLLQDRSNWFNKIRAYHYVLKNWFAIMQQRTMVQSMRCVSDWFWLNKTSATLAFEQASAGALAQLAHWLLDPCFLVWRRFMLQVVK